MSGSSALTSAELVDLRRFLGYPVSGAVYLQTIDVQSGSNNLDAILAGLSSDQIVYVRAQLTILRSDEAAIVTAGGQTLLVAKAAVFTRNPNEIAERTGLYLFHRRQLSYGIGIPLGIGAQSLVPAAFVV